MHFQKWDSFISNFIDSGWFTPLDKVLVIKVNHAGSQGRLWCANQKWSNLIAIQVVGLLSYHNPQLVLTKKNWYINR